MFIVSYEFKKLGVVIDIPNIYYITYWLLKQVPKGKVITYGDLGELLGDIRASRAVGRLMALNKYPDEIPCFKVVHRNGEVGKYSRGVEEKIKRLKDEGIIVKGKKIYRFRNHLVDKKTLPNHPYLESLQRIQKYLSNYIVLDSDLDLTSIEYVVSTDIAYIEDIPDVGIGVAVLYKCSPSNCKPIHFTASFTPIYFPYIPTYLAFRELPPLLSAISSIIEEKNVQPDLYIVDGHGVLHPRCFGIASHLGVLLNKPTIGMAKSKLLGRESKKGFYINDKEVNKVSITEKCYGYHIKAPGRKKGYYVSAGNLISSEKALEFVSKYGWEGEVNILSKLPDSVSKIIKKEVSEENNQ